MAVRYELARPYDHIVICESGVIPVTDENVSAFSQWVRQKYSNYTEYKKSSREPELDIYIRTNIFTRDMKTIWSVSQPYVDMTTDNLRIKRLILYRQRLVKKIKYMKIKLGKLTFVDEAEVIREQARQRSQQLRLRRQQLEAVRTRHLYDYSIQTTIVPQTIERTIVPQTVTQEEANKEMDDECVICMSRHKLLDVWTTPCKHQFGAKCLAKWKYNTCPLCRELCNEVTEYKL